jgi:hypothetical protein
MMKRFALFAICAMAVLASCQQKGKSNGQDAGAASAGAASSDNWNDVRDTVPMPVFLISRMPYLEMHYWTNVEEPVKEGDEEDEYFASYHAAWERQEAFRRHASQYTHVLTNYSDFRIKFFDEVLKDPDGNTPSIGQLHGRDQIPSLCARYKLVEPVEEENESVGIVAVTDSYLQTRRQLSLTSEYEEGEEMGPLPDSIVTKLEKRYGMKASRSLWYHTINNRYIQGCVQFEGEYKDAPADQWGTKRCLALEVIADSSEVYAHEVLGYYVSENEYGWNVDDDGIYINIYIHTAFEGPHGLEFCYSRSAPESLAVGIAYLRDGKYELDQYDIYQYMIDEEIPLWKTDIAELKKLYYEAAAEEGKDVVLSKYAHCFFDLDNEWVWMRDKDDQHGGIFLRKDGHFKFVGLETPQVKPMEMNRDYKVYYLYFADPKDNMIVRTRVLAFKDGEQIEEFSALKVEGVYTECRMNGKAISPAAGKAYLDNLPEPEEITAYFTDIDAE